MEMISKNNTSKNSKKIKASPETLYHAFTDPASLVIWFAPGEMKAKVHSFELKEGGGYQMSLFYPSEEQESLGKTSENEDRYTARFVELIPFRKIVQTITFDSDNPAFLGEMIMEVIFQPTDGGTDVEISFKNIPPGIKPEDNEEGTKLTLEKLAFYVE